MHKCITIPDKLYELMSGRKPNSFTIIEQSEGVGENSEQFTTRMSMSLPFVFVFASKSRTTSKITVFSDVGDPADKLGRMI